jgi:phosphate uptake regulator
MEDVGNLIRMASVLEQMIATAAQAFTDRDLKAAIQVLRADGEIDRLRNLLCIRHIEGPVAQHSVQVLFMAQALERAGDHTKNLAEEICHCITGHSLRHVMRSQEESQEQMFVRWLRHQHRLGS